VASKRIAAYEDADAKHTLLYLFDASLLIERVRNLGLLISLRRAAHTNECYREFGTCVGIL